MSESYRTDFVRIGDGSPLDVVTAEMSVRAPDALRHTISVTLHVSGIDGVLVVDVDTPEDSTLDVRVNVNEWEATTVAAEDALSEGRRAPLAQAIGDKSETPGKGCGGRRGTR